MDPVETFDHRGIAVEIHYDDTGHGSPREWDNGTYFVTTHRTHCLPNEIGLDFDAFGGWEEVEEHIRSEYDVVGFLWIHGYDHGQLRLTAQADRSLSCPWDAGIAGCIFMDRAGQTAMGTPDELVDQLLAADVETYDMWANGEVYGYIVDPDGEHDSCWGYVGEADYCRTEAIAAADWIADKRDADAAAEAAATALPVILLDA